MKVILNGNIYHLQAGTQVTRTPLVEFPANIRLDGQQQRKDRSMLSSWAIDRWTNGLGIERMNVDVVGNQHRLWDVENCDTRYPSQIVRSPALVTCTISPSRGDLDLQLEYLDLLYFCESNYRGSGESTPLSYAYKFLPPNTLGSPVILAKARNYAGSLSAVKAWGNRLGLIFNSRGDAATYKTYWSYTTPLGGQIVGTQSEYCSVFSTIALTRFSSIAELGGTIHLLGCGAGHVSFALADTTLTNMTTINIFGMYDTVGSYLAPLQTDGEKMYAYLPKGIYDFDLTPSIVVDCSRAKDKNCAQVMFRDYLYFKNKKSLNKYTSPLEGVGYDLEDGLPASMWGEITAMCSSWKYIFAAVKGPTYSHILTMDEEHKWQYYARVPSAGVWVRDMFLSDAPDAIDRLWLLFGNSAFPGYFLNPMVNPLQAGTYSYVPTGYFTPPIYDGGMAEEQGAFYDTIITGRNLSGDNKITCLYGLEGASPVTTLGIVGTSPQTLIFGSPYGIEGFRIQPKFLMSGTTGGTLIETFETAIVHYLKLPKERESFQFNVDLKETAYKETRPLEAIIGSLNNERNKRTLMPFWYGQVATKQVKVISMPSLETISEDKIYEGERSGIVQVQVAEIL